MRDFDAKAQGDALIRFYYKMDPDALEDYEWAMYTNEILWCLKKEREILWGTGDKK